MITGGGNVRSGTPAGGPSAGAGAPAAFDCGAGEGPATFLLRPLRVVRSWRRDHVVADLVAGATVAAVAIPQAMAYAAVAELPPRYGLYTAVVGSIVAALWGCSRFLSTGPVNAVSLLVLPTLLAVGAPGSPEVLLAASLLAVLAGLLSLALALLRFGALVTLASRSVLIGFSSGAAVHIALGQLRHLLGLELPATPELHRAVAAVAASVGDTNRASLALGLGTLAALVLLKRVGPRFPAALLAIAGSAAAVALLGLGEGSVPVVGAIPRSLPPPTWLSTPLLPDLDLVRSLAVPALAVTALSLIEAVAASQVLAKRAGDRLSNNQEFFGQGLANVATGLLSGYPCSGSFTRSALAQQSGARSHLAGVFTGLTVLAGMLALAPYARLIPRSAIAGVLVVVAWSMIDRAGIRRVLRTSRADTAVMAATFGATLVLPLDFAVLAGVVFSLALFVIRSSLPRVVPVVPDPTYRHLVSVPDRPPCPQLGVFDLRGPLFFGAVHHVEAELAHARRLHPGQNHVVLRMHGVDFCDLTGVELLESLVGECRQAGGDVFLVRPRRPVLEVLERSGFLEQTLGPGHVLEQERVIDHLFDELLDPLVCIYECEHRLFAECQALEKHPYDADLPPTAPHAFPRRHEVSVARFEELASDPEALVLDVREPEEYRRGHVPGATLSPLRLLPTALPDLPRDRALLLVCRSGRRTARATGMLEERGFTRVHGLRGGMLAWYAEGLPVGHCTEEEAATLVPVDDVPRSPRAGHERQVLAALRYQQRTDELEQQLELLCDTRDLDLVRGTLEELLDGRACNAAAEPPGVIRLDPDRPVLIVSDSHAQRRALRKLLLDRYLGHATNLASLVLGDLQLLLLGDLLHSERRNRWRAIEDEFVEQFTSPGPDVGPTPKLDEEMADGFGLAAMVLALQGRLPAVHCLRGNHESLLESGGGGRLIKYVSWPGEGEITRAWTLVRLGSAVAGKYAAWERRLPLLAIWDGGPDGPGFLASHTEPARPYTLEEIEGWSDEAVFGLTWTRNDGRYAPDLLRTVFGRQWARARYFVSHTGSEEGIVHVPRNHLVRVNKSRHLVAALVRPRFTDFEVHVVTDVR